MVWEEQQKRESGEDTDDEIKRTVSWKCISVMILNLYNLSIQGLEGRNMEKWGKRLICGEV